MSVDFEAPGSIPTIDEATRRQFQLTNLAANRLNSLPPAAREGVLHDFGALVVERAPAPDVVPMHDAIAQSVPGNINN